MTFDFSAFIDLTIGALIDILEQYGNLTQTLDVEVIISTAPPGSLTPETADLLRYIWQNPSLVEAGKQELLAALEAFDRDTVIGEYLNGAEVGEGGQNGGGGTVGVVTEDGGLGTATYSLPYSGVQIRVDGTSVTITGDGFSESLSNLERIQFADGTLALDKDGAAGNLLGLYEATFGRMPDSAGFKYWIDALDDAVLDFNAVANAFVASDEFQTAYARIIDDAVAFVTELYRNILDRDPEDAGLTFWANAYSSGQIDVAGALSGLALSEENSTNVDAAFANGYFF
ncbi:protein of unknown function [Fulvimarina manganoxydans]|uniref:DUF4214 domain-containing protein n=1 Tax=Fulvimarina manganoxydans TaxID=937218 RepID=A0A1W2EGP4_9HYPH|nr:DUF4214 domain-containing protein [Fulvimarina manganoxydans]SMD08805.1 protein of unknown function [Fulvimarina manganoxydans]